MMTEPADDVAFAALGLGGYDWPEVFKYAANIGEGGSPVAKPEGSDVSAATFWIHDVASIEATAEGEG